MSSKRFLPKFLLVAGFLSLFLVIIYQNQIKDFLKLGCDRAGTYVDYASHDLNLELERHRPLSLVKEETELKLYIGEPFRGFSSREWADFWNIIYGIFPKTDPEEPGLVGKRRQLTEDEIISELKDKYPQPFDYFKENHWGMFFNIIFKK
ncbi:MAG: hypothetical protein PHC71_03880 [Candidatus Omnitrophica bacterium]|nr:hypothetical protein [Candidatus Omnitrophota bacterium]